MKLKFWIGIFISAFFLYFSFKNVNFRLLINTLKKANYLYLFPMVLIVYFTFVIRAVRWKILMLPIKEINIKTLFSVIMIGFMANNLLPVRAGEIIRAYVIGEKEDISKSSSFGTIVVERVFDGFAILLLFILVIFSLHHEQIQTPIGKSLKIGGLLTFILYITVLFFIIGLNRSKGSPKWLTATLKFILPKKIGEKIDDVILSFTKGLSSFKMGRGLIMIILYSIFVWLVYVFLTYLTILSFGIKLPWSAPFFVIVMVCVAITLPSSPGFIGTYHAAVTYSLLFYGVAREKALGVAIILHAVNYFPIIFLGLFYLIKYHISIKEVSSAKVS